AAGRRLVTLHPMGATPCGGRGRVKRASLPGIPPQDLSLVVPKVSALVTCLGRAQRFRAPFSYRASAAFGKVRRALQLIATDRVIVSAPGPKVKRISDFFLLFF